jgi:hypothetical protein
MAAEEKGRMRALWRRLWGGADAPANVEAAQRTIVGAWDAIDQRIARIMRRADAIDAALPPFELAHARTQRIDALVQEVERQIARLRKPRASRGTPARPDAAAMRAAMRELVERVRHELVELEALGDDHERSAKQAREDAEEWRRRAMLAVHVEDDDLAREALGRALEHEALAAMHARELSVSRRVTAEVRAALLTLLPDLDGQG